MGWDTTHTQSNLEEVLLSQAHPALTERPFIDQQILILLTQSKQEIHSGRKGKLDFKSEFYDCSNTL